MTSARVHAVAPNDTDMLVAACIARVREAARRSDDVPLGPPRPRLGPRRGAIMLELPGPEIEIQLAEPSLSEQETEVVRAPARSRAERRAAWVVRLCAVVALAAGGAAFLRSPLAARPSVASAIASVDREARDAVAAGRAFVESW